MTISIILKPFCFKCSQTQQKQLLWSYQAILQVLKIEILVVVTLGISLLAYNIFSLFAKAKSIIQTFYSMDSIDDYFERDEYSIDQHPYEGQLDQIFGLQNLRHNLQDEQKLQQPPTNDLGSNSDVQPISDTNIFLNVTINNQIKRQVSPKNLQKTISQVSEVNKPKNVYKPRTRKFNIVEFSKKKDQSIRLTKRGVANETSCLNKTLKTITSRFLRNQRSLNKLTQEQREAFLIYDQSKPSFQTTINLYKNQKIRTRLFNFFSMPQVVESIFLSDICYRNKLVFIKYIRQIRQNAINGDVKKWKDKNDGERPSVK